MANKTHIDPLDPFGENEAKFKSKEIRHSRSRHARSPFINRVPDKKKKNNIPIIATIISAVIVIAIVLIVLNPFKTQTPLEEENPLVNPTGREASSEYTEEINDPEQRAVEQEHLDSVRELIKEGDWAMAAEMFEIVYPAYLDNCGRYDYWRSAVELLDNVEYFTINGASREDAEKFAAQNLTRCTNPSE